MAITLIKQSIFLITIYALIVVTTSTIIVPSAYGIHRYDSQTARFGTPFIRGKIYEARLQLHEGDPYLCGDEWPVQSNFDDLIEPLDGRPVALLAKRGQCSFEAKARTAMSLSPSGVVRYIIVYDDKERPTLSIMSAMDPSGISLGMLFISFNSGVDLIVQLMSQPTSIHNAGGFLIRLDSENPWLPFIKADTQSWMIASLTGIFLVLIFCGCAFFFVHAGCLRIEANVIYLGASNGSNLSRNNSQYALLTEDQVSSLPLVEYKDHTFTLISMNQDSSIEIEKAMPFYDENTTCSICLEEFAPGETIRQLLPCKHLFHTSCIVPWLTERQPFCPLCKTQVVLPHCTNHISYSSIPPSDQVVTAGISEQSTELSTSLTPDIINTPTFTTTLLATSSSFPTFQQQSIQNNSVADLDFFQRLRNWATRSTSRTAATNNNNAIYSDEGPFHITTENEPFLLSSSPMSLSTH